MSIWYALTCSESVSWRRFSCWAQIGEGIFEIRKWEYFRQPFEEGRAHLEALLAAYPDLTSWDMRKAALRTHIMKTLGLAGLKKCPLNPIASGLRKHDGYTVENIALEVLPGVWVCGSLYKPVRIKGKIPSSFRPTGIFTTRRITRSKTSGEDTAPISSGVARRWPAWAWRSSATTCSGGASRLSRCRITARTWGWSCRRGRASACSIISARSRGPIRPAHAVVGADNLRKLLAAYRE